MANPLRLLPVSQHAHLQLLHPWAPEHISSWPARPNGASVARWKALTQVYCGQSPAERGTKTVQRLHPGQTASPRTHVRHRRLLPWIKAVCRGHTHSGTTVCTCTRKNCRQLSFAWSPGAPSGPLQLFFPLWHALVKRQAPAPLPLLSQWRYPAVSRQTEWQLGLYLGSFGFCL